MRRTGSTIHSRFPNYEQLIIPVGVRLSAERHITACLPNEGCGVLAMHYDANQTPVAIGYHSMRNADPSPSRYRADARDLLAIFRSLDATAQQAVGIVHSHLVGPPIPSSSDLEEWTYPDLLMIIVSFAQGDPHWAAWEVGRQHGIPTPRQVPITFTAEAGWSTHSDK